MILVTGATGNVGREVMAALTAAGAPVNALPRTAGADLNEPVSLRPALEGVRAVFLLPGYRDMRGLAAEFARAGVERVVLLSGQAAVATDTANAVSAYMIDSETALRESGLAWTFLRPTAFMSNALGWLPQLRTGDVVSDAFGDVPIAIMQILGQALGRNLRFQALTDEEAWAQMSATTPIEYVNAFFSFYRDHTIDETAVHPTVEQLTGRPPRVFAQWVTTHAAEFRR